MAKRRHYDAGGAVPEDAANDRLALKFLNQKPKTPSNNKAPPKPSTVSKDPPSYDPDQKGYKKGGSVHKGESSMSKHHSGHHKGAHHPKHHEPKHHPEHMTPHVHHHKHGGYVDSHIPHMDHIRKNFHGK